MMIGMQVSVSGLALIAKFETLSLKSYPDRGGYSIGYGHRAPEVRPGQTCTVEQAIEWLKTDAACVAEALNRLVTVPLNQNQFDALASLTYNIGIERFAHSTLLEDLNARNYQAAAGWFPQWDHEDGIEIAGLERRRLAEQARFNSKLLSA